MADQRAQYTEEAVGAGHPTKADVVNRLALVEHNTDGTHKAVQPWVDKTDSRALGTVYQNTSGRDICLAVSVQGAAAAQLSAQLLAGASNPPTVQVGRFVVRVNADAGVNHIGALFASVGVGHYYKAVDGFGTATLEKWSESPAGS
ncbi:MAG: hypothetical protein HYU38_07205 [Candidatus Tectomicrobia bacterium]|nr:hypothetical protein [Candidatus Tectomicrobia bacterium]